MHPVRSRAAASAACFPLSLCRRSQLSDDLPQYDPKYAGVDPAELPRAESLKVRVGVDVDVGAWVAMWVWVCGCVGGCVSVWVCLQVGGVGKTGVLGAIWAQKLVVSCRGARPAALQTRSVRGLRSRSAQTLCSSRKLLGHLLPHLKTKFEEWLGRGDGGE